MTVHLNLEFKDKLKYKSVLTQFRNMTNLYAIGNNYTFDTILRNIDF